MSRQREVIYAERRKVLEGEDMHEWVTLDDRRGHGRYVTGATEGFPEEWDLDQLWTALGTLYPVIADDRGRRGRGRRPRGAVDRDYLHQDGRRTTPWRPTTKREERAGLPRSCASWSAASC